MAHFAQLDENNVVLQIIVVHNNELVTNKNTVLNEDGSVSVNVTESEDVGIQFCKDLYGADTNWVQTSYNGSFRGKYASIGDTYDAEANEFRSPIVVPSVDQFNAIETQQTVVIETQAPVAVDSLQVEALTSVTVAALNTTQIEALTTQQISGLE